MKFLRNTCDWPSLFAVLALCVLLGLVSGCSIFGKKEKAEFEPGSEWVEDTRDEINENVKDPDRKADLLALVSQVEKDFGEMDRVSQKLYADLESLSDNYNSSPEEFRKTISEFEASRKEVRDRIVDSRFKLRDLSTPEEWKEIAHNKSFYRKTIRQPGE
jgi:arsenate reductase-like glutaredoxin family protein